MYRLITLTVNNLVKSIIVNNSIFELKSIINKIDKLNISYTIIYKENINKVFGYYKNNKSCIILEKLEDFEKINNKTLIKH